MTLNTRFVLPACFLLSMVACTVFKKDTGHTIIFQQVDQHLADSTKAAIRGISNDHFRALQYQGMGDTIIQYRLLSPPSVNDQNKYPLVLVLHGSGSPIGTNNTSQLGVLAKFWAQPAIQAQYPAYILAPQFPRRSSNYVMGIQKVLTSVPDPCLTTALQLVDSLCKVLPIDQKRIYVMGFSMGASSTINCIDLRPGLFAAAIAISGIPSFGHIDQLAKTPLWIIHGNTDTENAIGSDSLLYTALQSYHDHKTLYWEIDHLNHDIYPGLYIGDAIPKWLFKHLR